MTIFLIILVIYIGLVILSLLGPYVDFRKKCEKGKRYTLEDFCKKTDEFYWVTCFIPGFNASTALLSLIFLLIIPLWNKIKRIRIV